MKHNLLSLVNQYKQEIVVGVLLAVLFLVTMKGGIGNGLSHAKTLTGNGQAFADSIGRGRYALILSIAETKQLSLTTELAKFASPDVARSGKAFVSIFPPGVALFLTPFYIVGSFVQLGQLTTMMAMILVVLINGILLYALARRLGYSASIAMVPPVVFLLATNAFVYAGVLAQHHISTMLLLLSIHTLFMKHVYRKTVLCVLLYALSLPVDWPNLILMLPVVSTVFVDFIRSFSDTKGKIRALAGIAIALLIPVALYGFYNTVSGNSPFAVGQFLPRVTQISGNIVKESHGKNGLANTFFLRKIPQGIFVLFFSRERGLVYFSPLMILSLIGIPMFWRKQKKFTVVSGVTIILITLLYASFGDVWGGPSFGPRYLIPVVALTSMLFAEVLKKCQSNTVLYSAVLLFGIISVAVSVLGGVTTTILPNAKESMAQHITYPISIAFAHLSGGEPGSFFYASVLKGYITSMQFYGIVLGIALSVFFYTIEGARRSER